MANLLPEKKMRDMQGGFRNRFVLATALSLLVSAAFVGLMLLPSYLVLVTSEPFENDIADQVREDKQGMEELKRTEALLRDVSFAISASSSPSRAIESAVMQKSRNIILTQFTYQMPQTPTQPASMLVSGVASSRDAINAYRDALMRSGKFPSVSIPVNAIVGASQGGVFTATLTTIY